MRRILFVIDIYPPALKNYIQRILCEYATYPPQIELQLRAAKQTIHEAVNIKGRTDVK